MKAKKSIAKPESQELRIPEGWRVAVVQMDCYDDYAGFHKNETDLLKKRLRTFLQRTQKSVDELEKIIAELRKREPTSPAIESIKTAQSHLKEEIRKKRAILESNCFGEGLEQKIRATLKFCLKKGVKIVVFPEYSIPARSLTGIHHWLQQNVKKTDALMVVAGTHWCKSAQDRKDDTEAYQVLDLAPENLGSPLSRPVAPVYVKEPGKDAQWRFIPKIAASKPEKTNGYDFKSSGTGWRILDFAGSRVAIMPCSDFGVSQLPRSRTAAQNRVHEEQIPLIVVPSFNAESGFDPFIANLQRFRDRGAGILLANIAQYCGNEKLASKCFGNSLIYGHGNPTTILKKHFPLTSLMAQEMYRIPPRSEAVMISEMRAVRRKGESDAVGWKLISVASIITKLEFPAYAEFYVDYSNKAGEQDKQQCVRTHWARNGDGSNGIRRIGKEGGDRCFCEKKKLFLDEANIGFPNFDWNELQLDLCADVVICDEESAAVGCGISIQPIIEELRNAATKLPFPLSTKVDEVIYRLGKIKLLWTTRVRNSREGTTPPGNVIVSFQQVVSEPNIETRASERHDLIAIRTEIINRMRHIVRGKKMEIAQVQQIWNLVQLLEVQQDLIVLHKDLQSFDMLVESDRSAIQIFALAADKPTELRHRGVTKSVINEALSKLTDDESEDKGESDEEVYARVWEQYLSKNFSRKQSSCEKMWWQESKAVAAIIRKLSSIDRKAGDSSAEPLSPLVFRRIWLALAGRAGQKCALAILRGLNAVKFEVEFFRQQTEAARRELEDMAFRILACVVANRAAHPKGSPEDPEITILSMRAGFHFLFGALHTARVQREIAWRIDDRSRASVLPLLRVELRVAEERVGALPCLAREIIGRMESPEVDVRLIRRLVNEFVQAVETVVNSLQWVDVINKWDVDDSSDDDGPRD